jgi:hypothetical protein
VNKQILTLLSVVVVICLIGAAFFVVAPKKMASSDLRIAQKLENTGSYDEAMASYAYGIVSMTHGKTFPHIPDKTTAANLTPNTWQKPIADFVDWLNTDKKISSEVSAAIKAVARCEPQVDYENYIYDVTMKKVPLEHYKVLWQQLFCPELSDQTAIIEKAFSQSAVIMTLAGNSNYSYEVNLVDCTSGKRINVPVDLDKTPPFLVIPGQYCLIFKSKTMFQHGLQSGKGWTSGAEAVTFTVPDSVNVIFAKLRTEVGRKKEKK